MLSGAVSAQTPCPQWGYAVKGSLVYALNMKKNRVDTPKEFKEIAITDFLAFPDDSTGDGTAYQLSGGYVIEVKQQGAESCNCKSTTERDFHIVVVPTPQDKGNKSKYVIVEITPRMRKLNNWAESDILGLRDNWVNFYGYKFADLEHKDESVKSNPGRKSCWRGTINEIHPVIRFVKLDNSK